MGLYEISVATAKIAESALVALVESAVVLIAGDVILLVVAVMVMVVPAVAFEPVAASAVVVEVDKMVKLWIVSWAGASLPTAVEVDLNSGS